MEGMRLAGNKIYVGIACQCWVKSNTCLVIQSIQNIFEMCSVNIYTFEH